MEGWFKLIELKDVSFRYQTKAFLAVVISIKMKFLLDAET